VDTLTSPQGINKWLEKQAANMALENLRSGGHKWKENLQWGSEAEKAALESWADFFPLLTARLLRTGASADKMKYIGLLVQARREELVTYWDWVDNVMKRCTKDKLAALLAALTPAQAYILARDTIAELLFMHGLLPDVRKTIESLSVEATTLTKLKEIGFRADKAMMIEMKIGAGGGGGGQTVAAFDYREAQGSGTGAGAGAGAGHQQPYNESLPGKNNSIAQQEVIVKMQQRTFKRMWQHWEVCQLPMPRRLRVAGITGHHVSVENYIMQSCWTWRCSASRCSTLCW
jgi:hypothetical protein